MLIEVKVRPRAKHDKVVCTSETSYDIWTTSPPDKGAANEAVIRLLAKELKIAPSRITLRRGAASRNKLLEVT